MAYLRFLDDGGQLQTKVLDSEHFTVGRGPSCSLSFESEMISREHMQIDLEGDGRFRVRDLGSRNKTQVNGELVRETLLTSGAVIRVGDRVMEFIDDTADRESIELEFLAPDERDPAGCVWTKVKSPLSLAVSQVERLAHLAGDQPLTARAEDIAEVALGQLVLEMNADRGLIALRGDKRTDLRILAQRGLMRRRGSSLTPVSQSFLFAPILQQVAGRYPESSGQLDLKSGFASTAVTAPLTFRGEIIGVLYLDRPHSGKPLTSASHSFCAAAAAQVGALIGEASRKIGSFAGREGATWMATIRRLQATLSDPIPSSDTFDVALRCFPGRMKCGDFGTVIPLDEQRCGIIVIDGGGQGVTGLTQASAIRMAVQAALRVSEDAVYDPSVLFNAINRMIASSGVRQILPCTFVGVDLSAGKLTYVNAGGMAPLLMVAPGRLVTLDQVSLVLGVDADYVYQSTRVDVGEVFRVVCHTDGLTDAASATGEGFGDSRLHEVLLDAEAFAGASEVVSRMGDAWSAHMSGAQPADDALVLVVARG